MDTRRGGGNGEGNDRRIGNGVQADGFHRVGKDDFRKQYVVQEHILADRFNGTALLKRYFFKFIVVTERPVSDCRNRRGDGDLLNARLFKYIRTDRL